jgi:hypothetical protein
MELVSYHLTGASDQFEIPPDVLNKQFVKESVFEVELLKIYLGL